MLEKINKDEFKKIGAEAVSDTMASFMDTGAHVGKTLDPIMGMAFLVFGAEVCGRIEKALFGANDKEEK